MHKHLPLDAPESLDVKTFTVTHPFSPFSGKTFQLKKVINRCGNTYLHFFEDDVLHSIPVEWTDYADTCGRVVVSRPKCLAYYENLVDLNLMLRSILSSDVTN